MLASSYEQELLVAKSEIAQLLARKSKDEQQLRTAVKLIAERDAEIENYKTQLMEKDNELKRKTALVVNLHQERRNFTDYVLLQQCKLREDHQRVEKEDSCKLKELQQKIDETSLQTSIAVPELHFVKNSVAAPEAQSNLNHKGIRNLTKDNPDSGTYGYEISLHKELSRRSTINELLQLQKNELLECSTEFPIELKSVSSQLLPQRTLLQLEHHTNPPPITRAFSSSRHSLRWVGRYWQRIAFVGLISTLGMVFLFQDQSSTSAESLRQWQGGIVDERWLEVKNLVTNPAFAVRQRF